MQMTVSSRTRSLHAVSWQIGIALALLVWHDSLARGQTETAKPTDKPNAGESVITTDDDEKEKLAAERYLEILRARPKLGTALDKVLDYHIQRGTLDSFCEQLLSEAKQTGQGQIWLLLGLVQSERGNDVQARVAFGEAESRLPDDPMASYFLGKTLTSLGENAQAINALKRAIEKKPTKSDALLVYRELGRSYLREQRKEESLAIWKLLEQQFPSDLQVREQIAILLREEGATEQALEQYELLKKATKDRYRQVEFANVVAQLKSTLGRRAEALADFEQILLQVNPDSWIYQDVRSQIDRAYLSSNDYDGLGKYYEEWVAKHPEDVDAMLRIGRTFSVQRRADAAKAWFRRAIDAKPSDVAARLALVDSLSRDDEFAAASKEMETVVQLSPENPDLVFRWAELVLSDKQKSQSDRHTEATTIWKRLLEKHQDNPVMVAKVADQLRGIKAVEEALALYRRAVSLAGDEPQYREYLGEYLYSLDRKAEALAVWKEIVSEHRATRDNYVRLSEIYSTFHQPALAKEAMAKVCEMQPLLIHRTRYAELLRNDKEFDTAIEQLEQAAQLAEAPEEHALVVSEQIKCYQDSGTLKEKTTELALQLNDSSSRDPKQWQRLALMHEAARSYSSALQAIGKAREFDPQSTAIMAVAARVQELSGAIDQAINTLRTLAKQDRRFVSSYLMQIANLYTRQGDTLAALATAKEYVSASNGNSESLRFYANLCFSAGKTEEGLAALQRNVRSNPSDRDAARLLAKALTDQLKTSEAIEVTWRVFLTSTQFEEKVSDVRQLAQLYNRTQRMDQFIARLQTHGRDVNRPRDTALLLAEAHETVGDLSAAKRAIADTVKENDQDRDLLELMIRLALAEYDWDSAIEYQTKLNAIMPSKDGLLKLAKLYLDQGDIQNAERTWVSAIQKGLPPDGTMNLIHQLETQGELRRASMLAASALEGSPNDWELQAHVLIHYCQQRRFEKARETAKTILAFSVPPEAAARIKPSYPIWNGMYRFSVMSNTRGAQTQGVFSMRWTRGNPDPLCSEERIARLKQTIAFATLSSSNRSTNFRSNQEPAMHYFADAQELATFVLHCIQDRESDWQAAQANVFTWPSHQWIEERKASKDVNVLWQTIGILETLQAIRAPEYPSRSRVSTTIQGLGTLTPRIMVTEEGEVLPQVQEILSLLVDMGDTYAARRFLVNEFSKPDRIAIRGNKAYPGKLSEPLAPAEIDRLVRTHKLAQDEPSSATASVQLSPPSLLDIWLARECEHANRHEAALEIVKPYFDRRDATVLEYFEYFLDIDREATLKAIPDCLLSAPATAQTGSTLNVRLNEFFNRLPLARLSREEYLAMFEALRNGQIQRTAAMTEAERTIVNPNVRLLLSSKASAAQTALGMYQVAYQTIEFPIPCAFQSEGLIQFLSFAMRNASVDIGTDIGNRIKAAVEQESSNKLEMAVDRLMYSYWLWMQEKNAESIAALDRFAELQVAPELGYFLLAQAFLQARSHTEALLALDAINPSNTDLLRYRELRALRTAKILGDKERVSLACQRLSGLKLSADNLNTIESTLKSMKTSDLSADFFKRISRGKPPKDLTGFYLTQYQEQGMKEQAVELARDILSQSKPNITPPKSSNPSASQSLRRQALSVLKSHNELQRLIEELEKRLALSPKSPSLQTQLIELYEANGDSANGARLRASLDSQKPKDPDKLWASAHEKFVARRYHEAVVDFLDAFAIEPVWMETHRVEFCFSYRQAKDYQFVANKLIEIGLDRIDQASFLNQFTLDLIQANQIDALRTFLRGMVKHRGIACLSALPLNLLLYQSKTFGAELPKDVGDVLAPEVVAAIVAKKDLSKLVANPAISQDGEMIGSSFGAVHLLLKTRRDLLPKAIEAASQSKAPTVQEQMLLAVLATVEKDFDKSSQIAKRIVEQTNEPSAADRFALWQLASLLATECERPNDAIPLLEYLQEHQPSDEPQSPSESPGALLVHCYAVAPRNAEAVALLNRMARSWDLKSLAKLRSEEVVQCLSNLRKIGERLLNFNANVDALAIVLNVQATIASREVKSRFASDLSLDQNINQINALAKKLQESALARDIRQLVENLAAVPADQATLDQMPYSTLSTQFVPNYSGPGEFTCFLRNMLERSHNIREEELRELLNEALASLSEKRSVHQWAAYCLIASRIKDHDALVKIASRLKDQLVAEGSLGSLVRELLDDETVKFADAKREPIWFVASSLKEAGETSLARELAQLAPSFMSAFGATGVEALRQQLAFVHWQAEFVEKDATRQRLNQLLNSVLPFRKRTEPVAVP